MPDCAAGDFEFVRHRVLSREEYLFEIDDYTLGGGNHFLLAHLRVFSFTPSAMKRILADWRAFRACVSAPLFAIGEEDDAKWRRFVSHLGFEPALEVVCNNDVRRLMYRSLCPGNIMLLNEKLNAPEAESIT